MTCGIYKLLFTNSQFYIGKSIDVERRVKTHFRDLKNGNSSYKLQQCFNIDKVLPVWSLIAECNIKDLNTLEKALIEETSAYTIGLNSTLGGDGASIGENNCRAKYTNKDIEEVFFYILDNKHLNLRLVSEVLNIAYSTVQNLSNGTAYRWLQLKYPEKYKELLKIKGTRHRIANTAESKGIILPKIICPNGVIYTVKAISEFAKINSLDPSNLRKVLIGTNKSTKGWKLYKEV